MAIEYKKRIFIDKAHSYLLRIDEKDFQKIVDTAQELKLSVNAVLNEAIRQYLYE